MATFSAHDITIPQTTDADRVPADMAAMVASMEGKLVGWASSTVDRDTRYGALPAGALVSSASASSLWLKTGSGASSWATVWQARTVSASSVTAKPGWSVSRQQLVSEGNHRYLTFSLSPDSAVTLPVMAQVANCPDHPAEYAVTGSAVSVWNGFLASVRLDKNGAITLNAGDVGAPFGAGYVLEVSLGWIN